jgi:hypothetical protein
MMISKNRIRFWTTFLDTLFLNGGGGKRINANGGKVRGEFFERKKGK